MAGFDERDYLVRIDEKTRKQRTNAATHRLSGRLSISPAIQDPTAFWLYNKEKKRLDESTSMPEQTAGAKFAKIGTDVTAAMEKKFKSRQWGVAKARETRIKQALVNPYFADHGEEHNVRNDFRREFRSTIGDMEEMDAKIKTEGLEREHVTKMYHTMSWDTSSTVRANSIKSFRSAASSSAMSDYQSVTSEVSTKTLTKSLVAATSKCAPPPPPPPSLFPGMYRNPDDDSDDSAE